MPNDRNKLKKDKKGGGEDDQVEHHADSFVSTQVVVTLPRGSVIIASHPDFAKDTVEIEVLKSREGESHERSGKNEPKKCIIAFAKTNWVVRLAQRGDK